jgi:hypothetical protein
MSLLLFFPGALDFNVRSYLIVLDRTEAVRRTHEIVVFERTHEIVVFKRTHEIVV